jgi:ABC-2 type transport system permease protein
MSAVDTAVPPAAPAGVRFRRPNTRFLRSELWLIFGRRRNWAGLAVLAVVPVIIAVAVKLTADDARAGGGPDFFSSITSNGLFVALAALAAELPLFLPLAVAAISADTIAGEANLGTLRYLLTVPVGRTRALLVKYAAVMIFALAATLLVATVGLVIGLVLFGGGPATSLSGTELPFWEAVLRLLLVSVDIAVGLCALGAIGMFVSSLTEQPIGGTIAIMVLVVLSFILDSIPQLGVIHPYLLTHHWMAFGELLRDPISFTGPLRDGLLSAGAYILIFLSAAWARLSGRDVTS